MSAATLTRPGRHAAPATVTPRSPECPLCGAKHRSGSGPAEACAAMLARLTAAEAPPRSPRTQGPAAPAVAASPSPGEITADDVELVLSSRAGALVACPWGGVMAVSYPYGGHQVLVDHDDVWACWLACGRCPERTAADLAWLTVPELALAA